MVLDTVGIVNVRPGVHLKSTLLLKAVIPIRSHKGMLGSTPAVTGSDRNATHTHTPLIWAVEGRWTLARTSR